MESNLVKEIAKTRAVVGYLGEKEQFGWWPSSFFSPGSSAFLAPVFTRTELLAKVSGVTRAAALVHDNHIGVGRVYHLFRLPEDMEQDIHELLHSPQLEQEILNLVADKETALNYLQNETKPISSSGVGPTRVGDAEALRNLEQWRAAQAYYVDGFRNGVEIYPYFTDSV